MSKYHPVLETDFKIGLLTLRSASYPRSGDIARQGTGLERIMVLDGLPCWASLSISSSNPAIEVVAIRSRQQVSPVTRSTRRISGHASTDSSRNTHLAP